MSKVIISVCCVLLLTSCLRTRKDIAYDRPGYGSQSSAATEKSKAYNPGGYNVPSAKKPAPNSVVVANGNAGNSIGNNQQMARLQISMQEVNMQLRELSGRLEVVEKQVSQNNLNVSSINIDQKLKNYEVALASLESRIQLSSKNSAVTKSIQTTTLNAFGRGELNFKQKNWQKAITEYQNYREQYPKGKDYSEATYKIGVCFQELKMKSEAKVFYQEAATKYPRSKAAKKSKFRLKQL